MTSASGFAQLPVRQPDELAPWLRAKLEQLRKSGSLAVVQLPAPVTDPIAPLSLSGNKDRFLFSPPGAERFSGAGRALELQASGSDRFEKILFEADRARSTFAVAAFPGMKEPTVRFFGGFAFQTGCAKSALWTPFGEASFVLPSLCYGVSRDEAFLTLALRPEELASARHRDNIVEEVTRWLQVLSAEKPVLGLDTALGRHAKLEQDAGAEERFCESVRQLVDAIGRGEFEKVVVARKARVLLPERLDLPSVLARLRQGAPESTCFCLERPGRVFIGASPELLLKKQALLVKTEALAGSTRATATEDFDALLSNDKELGEHRLVVRQILQELKPLASSLSCPESPRPRKLRHIVHLETPISVVLKSEEHVLSLLRRLHPTPAVGGIPTERALGWIAEHEADERGLYAAPLGWFDEHGDGEFTVALRSALIEDKVAHLYAGGGIVKDSHAESELEETRLKLARMLDALGAS